MNDRYKTSSALFTSSGCLTGDALMLFVNDTLNRAEFAAAEQHIAACPLCADAADGLRMWLKENNSEQIIATRSPENVIFETPEIPDKETSAKEHSTKSPGKVLNKFHARTNVINERIKQRLHTHALLEASESKRLSYKPFVWLAAAATIILFIGGFYVVWVQNQYDMQRLAEERASQLQLIEGSGNADTLSIPFPENKAMLAMKEKKQKGILGTSQSAASEVVSDEEVYNQDELNRNVLEAVTLSEVQQGDIAVMKKESKASRTDTAYSPTASKNAGVVVTKEEASEESRVVFTVVEEMPTFAGGEAGRNKFLSENIVYPRQAAETGIQGTVYVSFIVDTDGKIEDVKILRGIGGGCDEEALRVVKLMPPWEPGRQNGKKVSVLYNMPVYFKLQ